MKRRTKLLSLALALLVALTFAGCTDPGASSLAGASSQTQSLAVSTADLSSLPVSSEPLEEPSPYPLHPTQKEGEVSIQFCGDILLHYQPVKSALLAFLPKAPARKIGQIASLTNRVFFNFIRGQLTECVILGSLCYVGMSLLRLDYALLISSIVALSALIPILGAYIGAILGVIILLLVHPIDALIFLIFLLILQQVEGNLIYPRVVGSSIGLPPIWTLFAVVFWGGVLGVPGILFGTPATAVIYRLFRSSVRTRLHNRQIDVKDPQVPLPEEEEDSQEDTSFSEGV